MGFFQDDRSVKIVQPPSNVAPTEMMEVFKTALLQEKCKIFVFSDAFTEAGGVISFCTHVKVNMTFYETIQLR